MINNYKNKTLINDVIFFSRISNFFRIFMPLQQGHILLPLRTVPDQHKFIPPTNWFFAKKDEKEWK